MTILHGKDAVERFEQEYTEALNLENSDLTHAEFWAEMRQGVYREKFCELFAQYAPTAWAELRELEKLAILWLHAKISAKNEPLAAKLNLHLLSAVEVWAEQHGIGVQWVHFVALMTVRAMAYYRDGESGGNPTTLLYNSFPVMVRNNGNIETQILSMTSVPRSSVIVNPDQGFQEWDTLSETKAEFRKRLIEAYQQELDKQLNRLEEPVLTRADMEAHAHHIAWVIQRHAEKRSIRSLGNEWNTSRPGISKGIQSAVTLLTFSNVPEKWGATSSETL